MILTDNFHSLDVKESESDILSPTPQICLEVIVVLHYSNHEAVIHACTLYTCVLSK